MSTEKVSLTLDGELLAEARRAVGGRGLSGFVNEALRHQMQRERLARLLAELDEEQGPVEPRVVAEVVAEWPAVEERAERRRRSA
jgi:hypothetical protein